MNTESYELIFEGMDDDSIDSRSKLKKALGKQCVAQIFEIESLLDGGPFLVKRSAQKEDLDPSARELSDAGAKVLILKSRDRKASFTNVLGGVARSKSENQASIEPSTKELFHSFYTNYVDKLHAIMQKIDIESVRGFAMDLLAARNHNRQIFVFGNGGSASSASHMANDFTKQRFDDPKLSFRCMSLNDNIAWVTATANDFGYEYVFVNQLKNLLQPQDMVIGISSSGNSPNIARAIDYANERGALTYGIVGFNGGELQKKAKKSLYIPTKVGQYGFHEDLTLILNHIVSIFIYEQDRKSVEG